MMHVFFGGTFDPPHLGHHQIVLDLLRDPWADRVHLVPTGSNPLKDRAGALGQNQDRRKWMTLWSEVLRQEEPALCKSKLRLEWHELDSADAQTAAPTSDPEAQNSANDFKPNYTIDTLALLRAREAPDARWALVVGADLLSQLGKWHRVRDLLSQLSAVWVYPRAGIEEAPRLAELVEPELRALTQFRWMSERVAGVSSNQLRQELRDGALDDGTDPRMLREIWGALRS